MTCLSQKDSNAPSLGVIRSSRIPTNQAARPGMFT